MMIVNSGGIGGFTEREGFYKLVLYSKPSEIEFPVTTLPLAVYVPYREGKFPDGAGEWLAEHGFERSIRLERYTAINNEQLTINNDCENFANGAKFQFDCGADEVYAFLNHYFSWEDMDLPPREKFDPECSYCIRGENGNLLGVLYDMGHTRVLGVVTKARGMGIGGRLYRAFVEKNRGIGKYSEWIRPDNAASIAMFRKLGFEKDTLVTDCYVRR